MKRGEERRRGEIREGGKGEKEERRRKGERKGEREGKRGEGREEMRQQ